jgi:hypothetical protein
MPRSTDEWIESFEIFKKYNATGGLEAAEHDEVFAGPNPNVVSSEDLVRLEQLGWNESEYGEGFQAFV